MWKNGIEIYEYQPSVLHAKLAVADGRWVTMGSYNVNNISAFANLELNLDVRNRVVATHPEAETEKIIARRLLHEA